MMYVIKKGDRYVADANKDNSFTKFLDWAHVFDYRNTAKDASYPDKGEVIVKVSKNKQGKLVEVK